MKAFIIFILLLTAESICYPQDFAFNDKFIDSTINTFRQKWNIPGISVAIAKDGRLIYAKGFNLYCKNKLPQHGTNIRN